MADYDLEDRGAYTPYSREQLAFDPRDTRRRRPVPLTLMASAVVLVAMGGAALMFYQSGVRGRNEPPRAVGEQVGSIKTPAVQEAKPVDPQQTSLDVYVQDRPEPGAAQPVYTPAPEQPQPRVAATAQPAAQPAPQVATRAAPPPAAKAAPAYPSVEAAADAAETVAPAPAKPAKAAAKPTALAAAAPAKPKPAAKAAAPIETADAKTSDKAAPAGGTGMVQIGAYSSKALAEQEFAKVRSGFAKFTSGRGTHVEPVQKGAATLYRAAFTGFSKAQATAFCGALKAAGRACIVK